ncbi:hypothetical protein [Rufibacter sp. LB8]|uniref:hypothetical protein n=1 Tax=Rufibacter sp. LB8 TaxID=2777781 RepID=UPI00178C7205|nr:hypothetical protein [Rufibacter sp. LB8]
MDNYYITSAFSIAVTSLLNFKTYATAFQRREICGTILYLKKKHLQEFAIIFIQMKTYTPGWLLLLPLFGHPAGFSAIQLRASGFKGYGC